jgi:ATP-dependent RNA helicase SUPV3L1/SUV3
VKAPLNKKAKARAAADRDATRRPSRGSAKPATTHRPTRPRPDAAGPVAPQLSKAAKAAWVRDNRPVLPLRHRGPKTAVLHLGPTNSGKTHDSIAALAAAGRGVYAAPLRQLAHEAYERLSALVGPENVGLSTGEEDLNPGAPVLCCTVDKAPDRGHLLVLDEAHWVMDADRGHHWTRLALTGAYEHLHVISAAEAAPALTGLLADVEDLQVVEHRRLSQLHEVGAVGARAVRPGTLVVAFSRKAVYAVARTLAVSAPDRVGVLYGALPPATRRAVIDDFARGRLDVLVTTDVIGHGINVPATTVLFAETEKYDGTSRRPLHTWEAAQIAGRAGRFGLADSGSVGHLAGVAGLKADRRLIAAAVDVARGDAPSDLPQRTPRLRPVLDDLGATTAEQIVDGLLAWQAWARKVTAPVGAAADDVTPLVLRCTALLTSRRGAERRAVDEGVADVELVWRLMCLPIDFDPPRTTRWLDLSRLALRHLAGRPAFPAELLPEVDRFDTVESLEAAAGAARDARALLRQVPGIAGVTPEAAREVELACADRITQLLPEAIRTSRSGRCRSCSQACAPWFPTCADCRSDVRVEPARFRPAPRRPERQRSGRR